MMQGKKYFQARANESLSLGRTRIGAVDSVVSADLVGRVAKIKSIRGSQSMITSRDRRLHSIGNRRRKRQRGHLMK